MFLLGLCFCRWCTKLAEEAGIDADRLATSERCSVQEFFEGRLPAVAFSAEALVGLCREEVLAYQEVRGQVVTSLVAGLARVAKRRGARFCVIGQRVAAQSYASGSLVLRTERPQGTLPWTCRVSRRAVPGPR